jgi:hypothetical protein
MGFQERDAWTTLLLAEPQGQHAWLGALRRLGAGLALAAIFGLAIGARHGAAAMAVHAVGTPLALAAVGVLATPAFYIGVAHANLPIEAHALGDAMSRGIATTGLVLAGLAPAALLLTLSTESLASAAFGAGITLFGALALGLRHALSALKHDDARPSARWMNAAFVAFSLLLAGRIWWLALPMLGRGALGGG